MTPGPIDWPACDVPPPRAVIGTPNRPQTRTDGRHIIRGRRKRDQQRDDLVDAGVGRIERPGAGDRRGRHAC